MEIVIILSAEQEKTAQRLCDEGIGKSPDEENKTINELLQWKVNEYLRQKASMYLDQDRKKLSKEEISQLLEQKNK